MTELGCPACIDRPPLRPLDLHAGLRVPLRRCDACLGIWADAQTAAVAAQHYDGSHYVMAEGHGARLCRACGRALRATQAACAQCEHDQRLRCIGCSETMEIVVVGGIVLDVCRPCKSVFFDRGELGRIARHHGGELVQRVKSVPLAGAAGAGDGAAGDVAGELALDVLTAPGVLVETAVGAGQVALEAGAAAGEAAADVAGALLEILGGLFDGL